MKIHLQKEVICEALQSVASVVERRHTAPILSNVRLEADKDVLYVTATDNEVELTVTVKDVVVNEPGLLTTPARKLLDLCRSLPDKSEIHLEPAESRLLFVAGSFKSHLSTLPVEEFPLVPDEVPTLSIDVDAQKLKNMLDKTAFAMAQQDVRYFFNGMLFDISSDSLRVVATNGQRLATRVESVETEGQVAFIVPRKGVNELQRVLAGEQDIISLQFTQNHLRATGPSAKLVSKLIDGTFPDYQVAIPRGGDKVLEADRGLLRDAFIRASILSNEMYRNVKLHLTTDSLGIMANNPQKEDTEEQLKVSYEGGELEIGFNVSYLIDCLSVIGHEKVRLTFTDNSSAVLVEAPGDEHSTYVISPMVI